MQSKETTPRAELPRLPWLWTYSLLAVVVAIAVVRPLAPNGPLELVRRIAGMPLTLDIGGGRSVRLLEEKGFTPECTLADLAWSENATLILDCQGSLQAWSADGHLLAKLKTPNRLAPSHLQILGNPLRVVYHGRLGADGNDGNALAVWNVNSGSVAGLRVAASSFAAFSVDPVHSRVALNDRRNKAVMVLSLDTGQIERVVSLPVFAASLQWLPPGESLLVGTFNGSLLMADSTTGDVQELSKIYPDREGVIDGLVTSPDGQDALTYITGSGSERVEIHAIADGRFIARMQGVSDSPVRKMVWDPRGRFIACSTGNALILWNWHQNKHALLSLDVPSIGKFSISSDGSKLALEGQGGRSVRLFRIEQT